MKILRLFAALGLILIAHGQLSAAINPEEFKRVASDVVKLREIARVVDPVKWDQPPARQRITIIAEIVEVERSTISPKERAVIVIDYAINQTEIAAKRAAHAAEMKGKTGPQFMHEPDAPALDEKKEFWAHLAPVAGRLGNVNRHAGAIVDFAREHFSGPVFVPVAGQYSWDAPAGRTKVTSVNPLEGPVTYTGTVRTGMMAIGGETTGMLLETERYGTFELDVKGDRAAAEKLATLNGKRATISGDVQVKPGVEVKERRFLVVRAIREGESR